MKIFLVFFQLFFLSNIIQPGICQAPNIILILVDDLGYGDVNLAVPGLGVFKNPVVQTPNLSRLANESLVLTDHYAASPVCSPSRAGLLTGRTPTRCNINQYINDKNENGKFLLHGSEITLAEILKKSGYRTAIFGKWHLNGTDWEINENWNGWSGSFPKQQGFDEGIVSKEDPHFTRRLNVNTQKHPGDFFNLNGEPVGPIKGYTSDIISEYAIKWIGEQTNYDAPFFAFLSYDAVHIRIAAADKYEELYNTGNARKDAYYANITHLDAAIGKVLDALERLNIEEQTLVIFSSDNGPDVLEGWDATYFCYGTSYPLSGQKYQLYEGGIRVPGMVRWPGKISPRISDTPNSTLDILPTFCALTSQKVPDDREIDGANLLDFWLRDMPVIREKPLYWQYEYSREYVTTEGEQYERRILGPSIDRNVKIKPNAAIREGDYTLIASGEGTFSRPTKFALYNIRSDPEQKIDLSADRKEKYEEMKKKLLSSYESAETDRKRSEMAILNKSDKVDFLK